MADAVCLINETYQELFIIEKEKASLSTVQVKLTARDGLTGKCPPTSSSQPNGISPPRLESDSQDRKYVGKGSALQGKCTKIKLDTRHNRNTGQPSLSYMDSWISKFYFP